MSMAIATKGFLVPHSITIREQFTAIDATVTDPQETEVLIDNGEPISIIDNDIEVVVTSIGVKQ